MEANPAIATIGIVSLVILFLWPIVRQNIKPMAAVPPQLIVLVVAVILGLIMDLLHDHSYMLQGHQYPLGEQFLVTMPKQIFGMFNEITLPDFTVLAQFKAWKWVGMFFIIGTMESILSAKAIDSLDPWRRKTNMDRDVLGVGVANLVAALVGGLPMISEIVRSKANIDNGARTRFADMWHGVFLLVCVAFCLRRCTLFRWLPWLPCWCIPVRAWRTPLSLCMFTTAARAVVDLCGHDGNDPGHRFADRYWSWYRAEFFDSRDQWRATAFVLQDISQHRTAGRKDDADSRSGVGGV